MNLTRRDLLVGTAAGVVCGAAATVTLPTRGSSTGEKEGGLDPREVATVVGVGDIVAPSGVTVDATFVRRYVATLGESRTVAIRQAVADLDAAARSTFGSPFGALSVGKRAALLRGLGVDAATPRPDGTVPARLRYHLVNGLLYALFTSPAGMEPLGIENPIGHPGGYHGSEGG